MATAGYVAQTALKRLLVQAEEAPLEPTDYADFFTSMDDYMFALEANGVRLGYTSVSNVSDTMTVPDGALQGIIANMAIEVSPDYDKEPSGALVRSAKMGMRAMRRLGTHHNQTKYPGTLPRGSGSEEWTFRNYSHYSQLQEKALITLIANASATTVTLGEYIKVEGNWDVQYAVGFESGPDGRLRNTSGAKRTMTAKATIDSTSASAGDFTYAIYRNGQILESSTNVSLTTTLTQGTIVTKDIAIDPGEYLELFITNATASINATAVNCQFELS